MLLIDTGNFVARKNPPYGYDTPISLDALQYMKYDVLTVGEKEISWGLDELEQEISVRGLHIVSNNIMDTETGDYRFEPYRIVQVGRLKVGVTATIGGAAVVPRTLKEREGIDLADPLESSHEILQALRGKKVDVTVIIAHAGLDKAKEWTADLAGYDVVLVGYGGKKLDEPVKENGVILAASGARSDWLGELTLTVEKKQVQTFSGHTYELKLDGGPFDEHIKAITWTYLDLDENGNRIPKKNERSPDKAEAGEVKQKEIAAEYMGGVKCALCHADVQSFWATTPHAQAFQSVAQSEEWENPECWNCHTVGYGKSTGHPRTSLEPALWNVQCESCHGMGTEHVRGDARPKVDEKICLGCHTEEWSPDFDYTKAVKMVACTASRVKS
ncbi:MAG: multiheme c-type cytochrome [Candidatus Eisenbacteria bacterium]